MCVLLGVWLWVVEWTGMKANLSESSPSVWDTPPHGNQTHDISYSLYVSQVSTTSLIFVFHCQHSHITHTKVSIHLIDRLWISSHLHSTIQFSSWQRWPVSPPSPASYTVSSVLSWCTCGGHSCVCVCVRACVRTCVCVRV